MSMCSIVILCATLVTAFSTTGFANLREKRASLNDWPAYKITTNRSNIRQRRQSWPTSGSGNWNNEAQNNDIKSQNQNYYETDQNNQSPPQTSNTFSKESPQNNNSVDVESRQSFPESTLSREPPPPSDTRYDSQDEKRPPPPNSYETYDRRPPPPPPHHDRWDDRPPPPPPPRHDRWDDRPPPSRYYEGKPPHDRRPPPPDHHYDYYSRYDRRPPPPPPDRGPPPHDHFDRRYERDDHWGYDRGRDYHRPYDKGPPPDHYHHRPPPPPDRGPPDYRGPRHGGPPSHDWGPPPRDRGPPSYDRKPPPRGGGPPHDWGPPPRDRGPPRNWGPSRYEDSYHNSSPPRDRENTYETSPNVDKGMKTFTESSGPLHEKLVIADDANSNSNSSISPTFDQRQNSEPRNNIDIRSVTDKPFDIDTRVGFSDSSTNSYVSQDLYKSRFPPLFQVIPVTPES